MKSASELRQSIKIVIPEKLKNELMDRYSPLFDSLISLLESNETERTYVFESKNPGLLKDSEIFEEVFNLESGPITGKALLNEIVGEYGYSFYAGVHEYSDFSRPYTHEESKRQELFIAFGTKECLKVRRSYWIEEKILIKTIDIHSGDHPVGYLVPSSWEG